MLRITIPPREFWDEVNQEFVYFGEQTLQLEHSLISISKWESKWHKSFLSTYDKTTEEILDYIQCMTLTPNVNPGVYSCLTDENIEQINNYISDSMTATCFYDEKTFGPRETITSELIYYWMIVNSIPFECQKWHINRLITLIKVCTIKNQPKRKLSNQEILSRNARLNEERRRKLNTTG